MLDHARIGLVVVALAGALAAVNAGAQQASALPASIPGLLKGYLSPDALPDSLALLPAPPSAGSSAFALDEQVARQSVPLRGSSRWTQATLDADLTFPNAPAAFSCALDAPITEERTPKLFLLMHRTLTDVGLSTYGAKERYQRGRPFVANEEPICTPADQAALATDGSYPSGHTAIGWAWALLLTEIAPERADAILARGLAYGESRNVCNVHWHSDLAQRCRRGSGDGS